VPSRAGRTELGSSSVAATFPAIRADSQLGTFPQVGCPTGGWPSGRRRHSERRRGRSSNTPISGNVPVRLPIRADSEAVRTQNRVLHQRLGSIDQPDWTTVERHHRPSRSLAGGARGPGAGVQFASSGLRGAARMVRRRNLRDHDGSAVGCPTGIPFEALADGLGEDVCAGWHPCRGRWLGWLPRSRQVERWRGSSSPIQVWTRSSHA
jgi:hypothetical protein